MRRAFGAILIVLAVALTASATQPDYLIFLERRGDNDLRRLLESRIPAVMETNRGIFIEGGERETARLAKLGRAFMIVDTAPFLWDYYAVGLRPDSDPAALSRLGTVIHTEDNWVLLRLPRGAPPDALGQARVFLSKMAHEPLSLPGRSDSLDLSAPNVATVPLVQQMVNSVAGADIDAYWLAVTDNPPGHTRYTTSQGCRDASTYVHDVFAGLGIDAQYQSWNAGNAPNVIGTLTGAVDPEGVYIVIGHLDDLPSSGLAPGADDNASGVVNVLEAAKVMSCYSFRNTVKFIAVTGEETGLNGSGYYASDAQARGENILGVINMDMIGWEGNGTPVPENLDLDYDSNSQPLGQLFAQCASDYSTGLSVDAFLCPSLNASDHYPFWQHGWRAVCGITDNEGYCGHTGSYPYYHTSSDTIAHCGNTAFFHGVVKASVATLAHLAQPFKIAAEKSSYACNGSMTLLVGDGDLNTNPGLQETVTVSVSSDTESNPETFILAESSANSSLFTGIATLTSAPPTHGDGLLSVSAGDTVSAVYVDAQDCNGATNVAYTATASVDCTAPLITNVQVSAVTDTSALVTWTTNEPADGMVTYGSSIPPGNAVAEEGGYVTSHAVRISGLSTCTPYYLSATSADVAGNSTTEDKNGLYYGFTTEGRAFALDLDDVEGGTGAWTASGQWHVDTCRALSPSHAWKAGASVCPGTYSDSMDSYLTCPQFALGSSGHGYHLRFHQWYQTEADYDWCTVQISTNGGSSWSTLGTHYAGSGATWSAADYDLSAYTGTTVRVRFWLHTDSSIHDEGWYVDDIDVSKPDACGPILLTCAASGAPLGGPAPLDVDFLASASGGTPPYAYSWSFGDGSPAGSGSSPSHTYVSAGAYTAILTVTDSSDPVQSCQSAPISITVATPLIANPSADRTSGPPPLLVSFSGGVDGGTPPYSYLWTFGDGAPPESGDSPTHVYTSSGHYSAVLSVTDSGLPPQSVQAPAIAIEVSDRLMVQASAAPLTGEPPLLVDFFSSASGGTPPYVYAWQFGDGAPDGSGATTSHVYGSSGVFHPRARVTDSSTPAQLVLSPLMTVIATTPIVVVANGAPLSGPLPLEVSFSADASGGIAPLDLAWDYGDGSPAGTGLNPAHTYGAAGSYSVLLTATDAVGAHADAPLLLVNVVHPLALAASASPLSGPAPLSVSFAGSASGGFPPYGYSWDFGDGSPAATSGSPGHEYALPGSYSARLTVTDDRRAQIQSDPIAVLVTSGLTVNASADSTSGVSPFEVSFTATAQGGTPPYLYSWDFGDGAATASGAAVAHSYSAGLFAVHLTVTDSSLPMQTAEDSSIEIRAAVPLTLSASSDVASGPAPLLVHLLAGASGGTPPYAYVWTFGDGAAGGSGETATHTYAAEGTFTASVTVADSGSPTQTADADAGLIHVYAPLAGTASVSPTAGIVPLAVSLHASASGGIPTYTYTWDAGDGSPPLFGPDPAHTYVAKGIYAVTVTIHDGAEPPNELQLHAGDVTIHDPITISFTATNWRGTPPLAVTFSAAVSGGEPPYGYHWFFGDGAESTAGPVVSHTYVTPGHYGVGLTVTDSSGENVNVGYEAVWVLEPLSLSVAADPVLGGIPLAVDFSAAPSGGNPPYFVAWDFGDGTTGGGSTTSHVYNSAGVYHVNASVADSDGRTISAGATVTAVVPPNLAVVSKLPSPFRLKLLGSNLQQGCQVFIGGTPAPQLKWKKQSKLVVKGGAALKALLPKGQPVAITVVNPDGGVSAPVYFTR